MVAKGRAKDHLPDVVAKVLAAQGTVHGKALATDGSGHGAKVLAAEGRLLHQLPGTTLLAPWMSSIVVMTRPTWRT